MSNTTVDINELMNHLIGGMPTLPGAQPAQRELVNADDAHVYRSSEALLEVAQIADDNPSMPPMFLGMFYPMNRTFEPALERSDPVLDWIEPDADDIAMMEAEGYTNIPHEMFVIGLLLASAIMESEGD